MASITPQSDPQAPEHHVDLDATEARQGLRGRHVFVILTVSTVLAVAALFGVWTTKMHQATPAQPPVPAGEAQPHV